MGTGRAEPSRAGQRRAELATAASAVPGAGKWTGRRALGCGSAPAGGGGRGSAGVPRRRGGPVLRGARSLSRGERGAAAVSLVIEGWGLWRERSELSL